MATTVLQSYDFFCNWTKKVPAWAGTSFVMQYCATYFFTTRFSETPFSETTRKV